MVLIPPESRARRNPPPSLPPRAKRPERRAPANSRSNTHPFRPNFGPVFSKKQTTYLPQRVFSGQSLVRTLSVFLSVHPCPNISLIA